MEARRTASSTARHRVPLLATVPIFAASVSLAAGGPQGQNQGATGGHNWSVRSGESDTIAGPVVVDTTYKISNNGPSNVQLRVRDARGLLTRSALLEPGEDTEVGLEAGEALVASDATSNDQAGASGWRITQ